ncbi:MAG: hypothetical protein WDZ64_01420 [Parcubacteria group bacterium]
MKKNTLKRFSTLIGNGAGGNAGLYTTDRRLIRRWSRKTGLKFRPVKDWRKSGMGTVYHSGATYPV